MASSLRRLANNSGNAYRLAMVPVPTASSLYAKPPSKSLASQFLCRALCTATPDVPITGTLDALGAGAPETLGADSLETVDTDTLKPFDLEALRAQRAAFTEARRLKLEKIADEVMGLNKIEYKDYATLLRHKLCRGEKSLFDVKLEKFEPGAKLNVIRTMLDFSDELDLKGINDLLEGAPSVVKKGVVKEEAEKIVEKLKEAGATAVVE
ncbi:hypothetical protein ACS0TY_026724 [Phlomoides rotata]